MLQAAEVKKSGEEAVCNQDAFAIVLDYFTDVPGGKELARLVLQFHFTVQVSTDVVTWVTKA